MSKKKYKVLPKIAPWQPRQKPPRMGIKPVWQHPDMLEALRDQMVYAEVVKEQYEQAKKAFEARKASLQDRIQSSDVAGS